MADIEPSPNITKEEAKTLNAMIGLRNNLQRFLNEVETQKTRIRGLNSPILGHNYNSLHNHLERLTRDIVVLREEANKIDRLWDYISDIIDNRAPAGIEEFRRLINQKHLMYGLQGKLKEQLRRPGTDLPDDEAITEIIQRPYTEAPMPTEGGRRRTKRHRRHRRSKTYRRSKK